MHLSIPSPPSPTDNYLHEPIDVEFHWLDRLVHHHLLQRYHISSRILPPRISNLSKFNHRIISSHKKFSSTFAFQAAGSIPRFRNVVAVPSFPHHPPGKTPFISVPFHLNIPQMQADCRVVTDIGIHTSTFSRESVGVRVRHVTSLHLP